MAKLQVETGYKSKTTQKRVVKHEPKILGTGALNLKYFGQKFLVATALSF